MSYQITPLPVAPFQPLFALSDAALEDLGARRMIAEPNSAPCRVSLADADPGDRLILVNYIHLSHPTSPYRAGGPIFVRETAVPPAPIVDGVPDMLASRLLSVRVYDADWMMTDADMVEGKELDARLRHWFADPAAAEIHIHTARRGCYMARAERAD